MTGQRLQSCSHLHTLPYPCGASMSSLRHLISEAPQEHEHKMVHNCILQVPGQGAGLCLRRQRVPVPHRRRRQLLEA